MTTSGPRCPPDVSRRAYLAAVGTGVLSSLAGCGYFDTGIESEQLGPSDGGTDEPWIRHTKLTAADDSVHGFGRAVALAGDATTALISATRHEDSEGIKPGPAYVLARSDSGWGLGAKLYPEPSSAEMNFGGNGESTALSADATTALIGAERTDDPNGAESGAAFAFEASDGDWGSGSKLVPDDGERKDFFGKAAALSRDGSIALIGAWGHEHADGQGSGAVYVFERADAGWQQAAKILPDDSDGVGGFGWSVELTADATTAVIGAPGDDNIAGANAGSAYVFQRDGDTWQQHAKLTSDDGDAGDFFGASVAFGSGTILVGASEDDDPYGDRGGSAYVFNRADGGWRQQSKLVADDGDSIDLFGVSVALSDDATTALLGARVDEDPNGDAAGAAYAFEQADGAWSQQAKLVPEDGKSHDVFGRSVALADGTALIGTMRAGAYVF